jgi:hypothetical protein
VPTRFTDEELARVRALLEQADRIEALLRQDEHTRWFWSSVRTWALWISAVGSAMHWGWAALSDILNQLWSLIRH